MTTLRLLIDRTALDRGLACQWALFADSGAPTDSGLAGPAEWPRAHAVDALLAPDLVRVASLRLPPLPPARREEAVRYALEDQSIDGLVDAELSVSAQGPDGTLRVAYSDRSMLATLRAALDRSGARRRRIVPLSETVRPRSGQWIWAAADAAGSGDAGSPAFVTVDDGSVFEIDDGNGQAVPPALLLALAEAQRAGRRPERITLVGAAPAVTAAQGRSTGLGVTVENGGSWSWASAALPTAGVIEFPPAQAPGPAPDARRTPLFRRAAWILGIAASLHGLAVVADWTVASWRMREIGEAQRAVAAAVAADLLSAHTAPAAVARRHREARHRAGLPADDDLLALLARASTGLRNLPAGALRAVAYGNGQLLADLGPLPAETISRLQREIADAGGASVAAPTASGTRIRVSLD